MALMAMSQEMNVTQQLSSTKVDQRSATSADRTETPRRGPLQWFALLVGLFALLAAGGLALNRTGSDVAASDAVVPQAQQEEPAAGDDGADPGAVAGDGQPDAAEEPAGDRHDAAEGHHDTTGDDHDQSGGDDPAADGEQAAGGDVVEVSMTEFAYEPSHLELEAGTYTFVITNDGAVPHEWALAEAGEHHGHGASTRQLASGESQELTVELTPGEYAYMCHIEGHLEAGMEGSLTVTD